MSRFDSGVKSYIRAKATVLVTFPVDFRDNPHVCCALCPYYRRNYRNCGLNGEIVAFPDQYIGNRCPLEFIDEGEHDHA